MNLDVKKKNSVSFDRIQRVMRVKSVLNKIVSKEYGTNVLSNTNILIGSDPNSNIKIRYILD